MYLTVCVRYNINHDQCFLSLGLLQYDHKTEGKLAHYKLPQQAEEVDSEPHNESAATPPPPPSPPPPAATTKRAKKSAIDPTQSKYRQLMAGMYLVVD